LFHFGSLQSLFALHLKFNWLRSVLEPLLVFLGQFILQLAGGGAEIALKLRIVLRMILRNFANIYSAP
ncbi:MAG: hypothetical protein LBS96_03160, partial [Oscillospiraceae bacterium]|nr:hypothetical protein [Oscillospiraceae bacterium]